MLDVAAFSPLSIDLSGDWRGSTSFASSDVVANGKTLPTGAE
jgi:hypothetical protein